MSLLGSYSVFGLDLSYENEDGDIIAVSDFRDTQGHWAHDQILKWADYNIVVGNNANFMPNSPIIRGDLSIIIDRMLGLENTTYNYFSDLSSSDYYRESLLKCVAEGYINGIGDNKVNPKGNATREEVAVIMCRIFNIDTSYNGKTKFKDDSKISSWARPSVYALSTLGYLNGDNLGNVNPQSNITRAEIITLLNNFADTYIPQRDFDSSGSNFVSDFPKNIVAGRNISLSRSTVGRDIYLTQSASTFNLSNSTVRGRIVAFSDVRMSLENSSVEQICLLSGKSRVDGVSEKIKEIYVCDYATESELDTFPAKLVLESGVRVKVGGVMYENNTSRTKTYKGIDLKADISDEQGYVVGGPRVSSGNAKIDYENNLTIENIKITSGDNNIREVGVVWLECEDTEDKINPTYKNNDGKIRYSDSYLEPFDFEVGEVSGYNVYRVYVKDSQGLYAYGQPYEIRANDFDIDINVMDEDYPEKLEVEVVLNGRNIPLIRNVQVVYDVDELYSEEHNMISLRKYVEDYAENPTDDSKYLRFTGVINVNYRTENNEIVYDVPTAFGYIITFADGSIINRFPVIRDVLPQGVKPVDKLELGNVRFDNNKIRVENNIVRTKHVSVQEVGLVYKSSNNDSIAEPQNNASGWIKVDGGYNIGVNEEYKFNSDIMIDSNYKNTFYALYVKTSNGYWYSNVDKIENNWFGDECGPTINGIPNVIVLSDTEVVVEIPNERYNVLDLNSLDCILSVKENGIKRPDLIKTLNEYGAYSKDDKLYLNIEGLSPNADYEITMRLKDAMGLYSNVVELGFKTLNPTDIRLTDKRISSEMPTYTLSYPNSKYSIVPTNAYVMGKDNINVYIYPQNNTIQLSEECVGSKLMLTFDYAINESIGEMKTVEFERFVIVE